MQQALAVMLTAAALGACAPKTFEELPPPSLPQRAGVDSIVAARAEGVGFRAVGRDFVLHIYRDDRITLAWDAGAHQETFPKPEPLLPRWNGEIYETRNARRQLRIEVRRSQPCIDVNGARFPATVTVSIDGAERSGCGRDL